MLAQIESLASGSGGGGSAQEKAYAGAFVTGDRVEAVDGDERGVKFVLRALDGDVAKCEALDGCAKGLVVSIELSRLTKAINVGAHVKVADGRYAGQTGVVLERGELDGDHVEPFGVSKNHGTSIEDSYVGRWRTGGDECPGTIDVCV